MTCVIWVRICNSGRGYKRTAFPILRFCSETSSCLKSEYMISFLVNILPWGLMELLRPFGFICYFLRPANDFYYYTQFASSHSKECDCRIS